jgi:hypothetical protein
MTSKSSSPRSRRDSTENAEKHALGNVPKSTFARDKALDHERALDLIGASEKDRTGGFPPDVSPRR